MAALFRGGIDIAVNVPFTDDFPTAAAHLAAAGVTRCDHIEPLPDGFRGGWIASPGEVADSHRMTSELVAAGATLVAPPVETPWRSLNSRLDAPAGLHITLFQELDSPAS